MVPDASGHSRGAMYRHKATLTPPPAPETVEAPALPMPMAPMVPTEMAIQPPRVSFRDGVLTVDSQNSKLSDILIAIHKLTGTEFDPMPEIADRTAVHLVGSPGDVVSGLLRGSSYGYVLISSAEDSTILQKVMLIAAEASSAAPTSAAGRMSASRQPAPPPPAPEPVAEPEPAAPAPDAAAAASSTSASAALPGAASPANPAAAPATKETASAATTATDDAPKDAPNPATQQGIVMPDPVQFAAQATPPKADSSGQQPMSGAGQYMQELYKLRVQQQPGGQAAVVQPTAATPQ